MDKRRMNYREAKDLADFSPKDVKLALLLGENARLVHFPSLLPKKA